MVPKIITHAALVVALNKKDRIRVLDREILSKNEQHSLLANVPLLRLEKCSRRAQSNRTQAYVAHFWKNHCRLLLGYWNVFIPS